MDRSAAKAVATEDARVWEKIRGALAWIGMVALGILAIVVIYLRRAAAAAGVVSSYHNGYTMRHEDQD